MITAMMNVQQRLLMTMDTTIMNVPFYNVHGYKHDDCADCNDNNFDDGDNCDNEITYYVDGNHG